MIHGKLRNGGEYWTTMNNVLQSAIDANYKGVDENAIVIAPQFYSTKFNEKQYSKNELAWPDVNAWQAGDPASHPDDTQLTSIDALDAIIESLADQDTYPALTNVTVVGHGGGGQLGQRYATIAKNQPSNIHIRYIHGDPSSGVYFTKDRPLTDESVASIADCPLYNTWRYGFDNFTGTADGLKKPEEYFQQYISRDVVSIVGYQDTTAGGDQYCMALLQGGVARRDRNLAWWQYINTLARTNEDLTGFPGNFSELPDWSNLSQGIIGTKLVVVEDADHDAEKVFESDVGRAALFDVDNLPTGWRPRHWVQKPAIKKSVPSSSTSADSARSTDAVSEDDQQSGAMSTFLKQPITLLSIALAAGIASSLYL
ncbi:hypothetical protein IE81DRAFT_156142 [Ceraceosorus guamensis]|uniref:Uncharacterized protein n=1 Tax=Ceraceosorus guamensis TaxID=1522189 RepID=A0A316VZI9_9BASI|nr:hypothetical protein IE81DRAFT_156142 [Ceraceosorus guamensis]PWN41843.1 hypothetical protein IE81DRAFT_156142 [Ceraceosorus guamensis]